MKTDEYCDGCAFCNARSIPCPKCPACTPTKMATINVNLYPCNCGAPQCRVVPVRIFCPIPRSVVFEVVLGECTTSCISRRGLGSRNWHADDCPARHIQVACSISGKMWEESEVTEVDPSRGPDGFRIQFRQSDALIACRERWALVKALVLGHQAEPAETEPVRALLGARDAVFTRLLEMAQAEQAHYEAMRGVLGVGIPEALQVKIGKMTPEDTSPRVLEAFVKYLISQVGGVDDD